MSFVGLVMSSWVHGSYVEKHREVWKRRWVQRCRQLALDCAWSVMACNGALDAVTSPHMTHARVLVIHLLPPDMCQYMRLLLP